MSCYKSLADQQPCKNSVIKRPASLSINLCAPKSDLTCFGCCPPIRPPHYDPLDYASILRREFAENRQRFLSDGPSHLPIVGFSCWALGFLDSYGHKIGCLLHPEQNQGEDLRHLVGYGSKCSRESCHPARVFCQLSPTGQAFWLDLASGLNSFYFSSQRANPLFHILNWGVKVLNHLHSEAIIRQWTVTELLNCWKFVTAPKWRPKAHGYLFSLVLDWGLPKQIPGDTLERICQQILQNVLSSTEFPSAAPNNSRQIFSHQLPMDEDFNDFIRLALGWKKTTPERAQEVDSRVHRLLKKQII